MTKQMVEFKNLRQPNKETGEMETIKMEIDSSMIPAMKRAGEAGFSLGRKMRHLFGDTLP